jgi:hypothetical protein
MRGDTQLSVPCKSRVGERCVVFAGTQPPGVDLTRATGRRIVLGHDRHGPIPKLDYLG